MKNKFLTALLIFCSSGILAQQESLVRSEIRISPYVEGTLVVPETVERPNLVIFVQGSGPTDRDGNQSFMKNDALKKLATTLAEEGIASYRFDKRIVRMDQLGIREEDIRFGDFVTDVSTAIDHFRKTDRFDKLIVLGHSQGSLVGMLAAHQQADAFISIAGAAEPIDSIIVEQIGLQAPQLQENAAQSFQDLREKGSSQNYHPMLEMIFRPSVQPFILSWMQYNPKETIQDLEIPVLLITGSKDLQVEPAHAEELKEAYPEGRLVILDKMNHVFRKIEGDDLENSKSYNEPGLPLHPELGSTIANFIRELE